MQEEYIVDQDTADIEETDGHLAQLRTDMDSKNKILLTVDLSPSELVDGHIVARQGMDLVLGCGHPLELGSLDYPAFAVIEGLSTAQIPFLLYVKPTSVYYDQIEGTMRHTGQDILTEIEYFRITDHPGLNSALTDVQQRVVDENTHDSIMEEDINMETEDVVMRDMGRADARGDL